MALQTSITCWKGKFIDQLNKLSIHYQQVSVEIQGGGEDLDFEATNLTIVEKFGFIQFWDGQQTTL
jgi:hypothetical protein